MRSVNPGWIAIALVVIFVGIGVLMNGLDFSFETCVWLVAAVVAIGVVYYMMQHAEIAVSQAEVRDVPEAAFQSKVVLTLAVIVIGVVLVLAKLGILPAQ